MLTVAVLVAQALISMNTNELKAVFEAIDATVPYFKDFKNVEISDHGEVIDCVITGTDKNNVISRVSKVVYDRRETNFRIS